MNVCIAASMEQRTELEIKKVADKIQIHWVSHTAELLKSTAAFLIDCTFTGVRLPLFHKPLLIHSPVHTLSDLDAKGNVGRFCAWSSFLNRNIWEIAVADATETTWLHTAMRTLGWDFYVVKDTPGLIAPRITCNIINEAYYALKEGISTKEEIDLAMKLGTNYPYGPFEWAEKIGVDNVQDLLHRMNVEKPV